MKNKPTKYLCDKGCIIKVSPGITGGTQWMTCRVKPSGSLQRVKSKYLPLRSTREEAQRDLDAYALMNCLKILQEQEK